MRKVDLSPVDGDRLTEKFDTVLLRSKGGKSIRSSDVAHADLVPRHLRVIGVRRWRQDETELLR